MSFTPENSGQKGTKDQVPGTKIEIPNIRNWKIAGL
jgi:hypothetical protein